VRLAEATCSEAPAIAEGLARIEPGDLAPGTLLLSLSVSVLVRRAGADLATARRAMLDVRAAIIEAAGLEARTEPVPLLAGDQRTVVLHLSIYLDTLLDRAASVAGISRSAVIERALVHLSD
jgi:hypothetical protein